MARPYKVALVQLVSLYEDPDATYRPQTHDGILYFLVKEIGSERAETGIRYPKLSELLQGLRATLPSEDAGVLEQDLLEKLHSLQAPDDLLQSFMEVHKIMHSSSVGEDQMAPARSIYARSALGIFLRRCVAEVIAMPFEGLCRLCSDVIHYVAESSQHADQDGRLCDNAQLEQVLDAHVAAAGHAPGGSAGNEIEADMTQLTPAAGALPKVHYLRHLAALRRRDAPAADAELRRYFDYSSGQQCPTFAGAGPPRPPLCGAAPERDQLPAVAGASGPSSHRPGPSHIGAELDPASAGFTSSSGIGRFQSALLSLGAAHTALGHPLEAYEALEETVRIAQANSDGSVLVHALAALCRLTMASSPAGDPITIASLASGSSESRIGGGGNALPGEPLAATHHRILLHLLHRCVARSRELKLPHLVAFARLAIAQVHLQRGEAPRGAGVGFLAPGSETSSLASLHVGAAQHEVEALRNLTALAVTMPYGAGQKDHQPGAAPGAPGLRSLTDIFPSTGGVFTGAAGAPSSAAAVAKLAGQAHLVSAASWSQHGCLKLAAVQGLMVTVNGHGAVADLDDAATSLAGLAEVAAASQSLRDSGLVLQLAAEVLPGGTSHPHIKAAQAALAARGAANAREPHTAAAAAGRLLSMAPPTAGPECDLWMQAKFSRLQALMAAWQFPQATGEATMLFHACLDAGQQVSCVRVLGLLGRCHLEAGSPATAIPYLLACSSHYDALGMDLEGADATITLAEAWCSLGTGHVHKALDLLRRLLPLVLGHGGLETQGRAQLAMARAMLLAAQRSDVQSNPRAVLGLLSSAAKAYTKMMVWPLAGESHYLAALVSDSAGLTQHRDVEAEAWKRCTQKASGQHGYSHEWADSAAGSPMAATPSAVVVA